MTHEWYLIWKQSIDIIIYVIFLKSASSIEIFYILIVLISIQIYHSITSQNNSELIYRFVDSNHDYY